MHEKLDRKENVKIGSEKSFGLTFGALFFVVGILPTITGRGPRWWAIATGILFLVITLLRPSIFRLPHLAWFRFGLILNRLVSPLILASLFYLVFTPMGLLLKLLKKDILALKLDKSRISYWIKSETPVSSMKDQF